MIPSNEVPRIGKFIQTHVEWRKPEAPWEGGMESYCSTGTEFLLGMMSKFWIQINDG